MVFYDTEFSKYQYTLALITLVNVFFFQPIVGYFKNDLSRNQHFYIKIVNFYLIIFFLLIIPLTFIFDFKILIFTFGYLLLFNFIGLYRTSYNINSSPRWYYMNMAYTLILIFSLCIVHSLNLIQFYSKLFMMGLINFIFIPVIIFSDKINFNVNSFSTIYKKLINTEFLKFVFIGIVGFINVQFFKIFIYDENNNLAEIYLNYEFIQRCIWFISGLATVYYTKYVFKNKKNPYSISINYLVISFIFICLYYIFNSSIISLIFDSTYLLNDNFYLLIILISSTLVAYVPILDTYLNAIQNFSKMLYIYLIVLIFTVLISCLLLFSFKFDKIIAFCLSQSIAVLLACVYFRISK